MSYFGADKNTALSPCNREARRKQKAKLSSQPRNWAMVSLCSKRSGNDRHTPVHVLVVRTQCTSGAQAPGSGVGTSAGPPAGSGYPPPSRFPAASAISSTSTVVRATPTRWSASHRPPPVIIPDCSCSQVHFRLFTPLLNCHSGPPRRFVFVSAAQDITSEQPRPTWRTRAPGSRTWTITGLSLTAITRAIGETGCAMLSFLFFCFIFF